MNPIILYALLAAALFGASTPFAKLLLGDISPVLLAGLLYLGSGLGLSVARLVRDRGWRPAGLARAEWPWLLGAIFFGGVLGYGISLVLFVLALRGLGTARTGAYFSTAPFIGALVAVLVFGESPSLAFWLASALMGLGVWLHLTERHAHQHVHEPMEHAHQHTHDEHHQHEHPPELQGRAAHSHLHQHAALSHKHPHFPDIHHRHPH